LTNHILPPHHAISLQTLNSPRSILYTANTATAAPTKEKTTNNEINTKTTMTPCPKEYRKLFRFKGGSAHKLYEPVIRAFHSRGWSVTKNITRAHVLWRDQPNNGNYLFTALKNGNDTINYHIHINGMINIWI
jgi:hypothetical protein